MTQDTTPVQDSVGGEPAGRPVGHQGTRVEIDERPAWSVNGMLALLLGVLLILAAGAVIAGEILSKHGADPDTPPMLGGVALAFLGALCLSSFTITSPGDTKVVQLFGRYMGTIREPGLRMSLPFTTRKRVSVKVNNFETHELKVNDANGNPVNIAAIVVWQVADTAKAKFAVEHYEDFVAVQAESALRHVASIHPYDNAEPGQPTLRGATDVVAGQLAVEVADRIALAGLEVIEARISSLAYAPEIAQAMLQRQQASAIIAAREQIVEGAVTMVQSALRRLETEHVVELDEERKAQMVSNLLVVLCGESRTTPVINTGSLYQ